MDKKPVTARAVNYRPNLTSLISSKRAVIFLQLKYTDGATDPSWRTRISGV